MLFKRYLSQDLQAYSYLIADEEKAIIVDPAYDIKRYLDTCSEHGLQIIAVLETHRHEDQVSGAKFLAEYTNSKAYHSAYEDLSYAFGNTLDESQSFKLSEQVTVKPIHTPGHTLGHLCFLIEYDGIPYSILTGDTMFYGGVGRTDFYGEENLVKMTTLLHESIYEKIMPLGDHVIVMPGHAAGSACGDDMDEVPYSTLGFERLHNAKLDANLENFLSINAKTQYKNPAFSQMEEKNVIGAGALACPSPVVSNFSSDKQIVDIRTMDAFAAAHIPGTTFIPASSIASYLGWFYDYNEAIYLVVDDLCSHAVEHACSILPRIGFTLGGLLPINSLETTALDSGKLQTLPYIFPEEYKIRSSGNEKFITLDVRKDSEFMPDEAELITNRFALPYQELKARLSEIPEDKDLVVLCAGGPRSSVSASWILKHRPNQNVKVLYGGIASLKQ